MDHGSSTEIFPDWHHPPIRLTHDIGPSQSTAGLEGSGPDQRTSCPLAGVAPFPRDEIYSRWATEVADPDVDVYVIEHEGRISGLVATRGNELLHLGTAVQTWGTGLAVAAHNELLELLAAAGLARIRLRVFEDNHRAIRFYEGSAGAARQVAPGHRFLPPHPVLVEYEREL